MKHFSFMHKSFAALLQLEKFWSKLSRNRFVLIKGTCIIYGIINFLEKIKENKDKQPDQTKKDINYFV